MNDGILYVAAVSHQGWFAVLIWKVSNEGFQIDAKLFGGETEIPDEFKLHQGQASSVGLVFCLW